MGKPGIIKMLIKTKLKVFEINFPMTRIVVPIYVRLELTIIP